MNADNPENAIKAFTELSNNVPAIGFFSRNKRIRAYIAVTNQVQKMIDSEQISQAEALFVLSLLVRKHQDFQKASMMVALNLPSLGSAPFKPIGFQYANELRVNLKMSPVEGENSVEA